MTAVKGWRSKQDSLNRDEHVGIQHPQCLWPDQPGNRKRRIHRGILHESRGYKSPSLTHMDAREIQICCYWHQCLLSWSLECTTVLSWQSGRGRIQEALQLENSLVCEVWWSSVRATKKAFRKVWAIINIRYEVIPPNSTCNESLAYRFWDVTGSQNAMSMDWSIDSNLDVQWKR